MSLRLYGRILANDNSWVALSADPVAYVTNWYPKASAPPNAFQAPAAWVRKIALRFQEFPNALWRTPGMTGRVYILAMLATNVIFCKQIAAALSRAENAPARRRIVYMAIAFTIAMIAMFPGHILTGYFDTRYFSLAWFCVLGWITLPALLYWRAQTVACVIGAVTLTCLAYQGISNNQLEAQNRKASEAVPFPMMADADPLISCARLAPPGRARVLFLNNLSAARMSAVYGLPTSMTPHNFLVDQIGVTSKSEFLTTFGIGFIVDNPQGDAAKIFPADWLGGDASECGPGVDRLTSEPR